LRTPFRSVVLLALLASPAAAQTAQPNIVLFIMDDMGYGDIGSYGVPDAKTPNIDRLAREGVKLTHFYANAANCSPTRTGFLTGQYQQRHGIETPLRVGDARGLPASDHSLPRLLKSTGYTTGLVGKWHLGDAPNMLPRRHGFDEFWGFLHGAVDYYAHSWMNTDTRGRVDYATMQPALYHNEQPVTSAKYVTDAITEHANAFILAHRTNPFFLEVSYNAPHWPFQPPDLPAGKRDRPDVLHEGTRAEYVTMLERADRGVGEILNTLDKLRLAGNTIVMFTSDNGGEWLSRNAPLFHRKSTLWEGGIRVPLLVRWPGQIRAGTTSAQVGITMDLTATILAAAGVTPPATYQPEGINLLPMLQKAATVERTLFWRISANGRDQKAARRGRWKYIKDGTGTIDGAHEMIFDLNVDPGERNDLAMHRVDLVNEMRALVARWEQDISPVVITPVIHSSIQLEHAGKVIQIDPWSQGDLSKLKPADLILITDDVNHHLDVKAIAKLRKPGAPIVIAANGLKQVPDGIVMANGDTRDVVGFRIEATPAYDVTPGVSFHPKGEANGYIVTIGGQRIYIVGVTECVPEIRAAKDIDVAFFPMNLPAARMEPADAIECIKAFKPKVVYPFHYDQDWVTRVNRGQPRGTASTRGLQELKDALQAAGIEVRLADWYPRN
jgi:arylsulfatase A-like enzyme/L-ascorbate metabolism protein UlaG (beta-lactamase superfamily)